MKEHNGKVYIENKPHDFKELLEIVSILRSPEGCEWDRAQTFESMKKCLTDEANEVLTAIDNKDYTSYQKILNEMSKNLSKSELFSYMGKYFKRMQYISLNKNDDELAKILSIKPYAVKMSRQYVVKNGIKYYINLYEKYVELDYKVKSGKISVKNHVPI